jgi:glyoxylase-like metal-dependent hydrolase (beta-lactamase superfamily II)
MVSLTQHTIKIPHLVGPVHCYSGTFVDELVLFDAGLPTFEAENYFRNVLPLYRLHHVIITHSKSIINIGEVLIFYISKLRKSSS